MKELTVRQEAFCMEYAKHGNATEAYRNAGYKTRSEGATGVCASKLLRNAKIKARLKEIGEETTTSKVLSIQQRKELLTEFATDPETTKTDRLKAVDLLNKMDSVYVQRNEVSIDKPVVLVDDIKW